MANDLLTFSPPGVDELESSFTPPAPQDFEPPGENELEESEIGQVQKPAGVPGPTLSPLGYGLPGQSPDQSGFVPAITKPIVEVGKHLGVTPQNVADAADVLSGALQSETYGGEPFDLGQQQRKPIGLEKAIAGSQQAVVESLDFFTSPLGIATLGMGTLPVAAQKAAAAAFITHMTSTAPEQLQSFLEAKYRGDKEGMAKSLTGMGLTAAFIAGGAKEVAKGANAAIGSQIPRGTGIESPRPFIERVNEVVFEPPSPVNKETGPPLDIVKPPNVKLPEAPVSPLEFTPAIKTASGEIKVGKPDKPHDYIFSSMGKPGMELLFEHPQRGFVRGNEFLSREEAAKLLGETEPLQSERLRILREEFNKQQKGSETTSGQITQEKEKLLTEEPTPTAADAPAAVTGPVEAVAKVGEEINRVITTEGSKDAKEVKSQLVRELEKLIVDAPEESTTKITVEIPGDGTFTVPNNKTSLQTVLDRAKKIATNPGEPLKAKLRGTSKEDKAWVAEQVKAQPPATKVQGAIASGVPSLTPGTAPVQLTPKSQRQIITDLAKGLKVPIRFGRLTTRKFAGYFKPIANLIGAKKANQIPLVSHEVGHKLDATFKLSGDKSIAAELDVLGDPATPGSFSSWTKSKTKAYKMGEGVAEFTRLWLTDPPQARLMAPNTNRAFEAALNANKDFGDTMRQAQDDILVWRNSEPQARLRSHISIGDNPNKTPYTVSQLTRDLVDDLHFARLAVDDANRMGRTDLSPSENFYQLARTLRGSYGMADTFIRQGVTDFKTKAVQLGTGLEDALKPVSGRINDFRDWIVAKQAQELHRQGKQTGLVPTDVDTIAVKFDSDPAFQEAFTKIKAWNDALLQYSVDAGLVTPEGAAAMRKMNQDYVPFHRVFEVGAGEPSALEGGGVGRGLNVGKPGSIRGRHGSSRDIVDPLETMVKNAYSIITASEKSAINLAVADLANKPGMGKWVERIATPKEMVKVGIDKIRKELEANGADLTGVPDDLLLSFFQNSGKAPFGENTIKVVRDGKAEFYRLNKDLFDTFHALDLEDSGKLVRILASPAQLLRSGVTLAPDFALANALRDTFSSAILSKYNAYPFEVTLRGLGAMINNPKLVAEWAAAGGKNSIEANYFDRAKLQNFLKEKISKDLTPAEQALVFAKSPLTALRWLTGISEEATRIGEYQKAFNALTKQGMPEGEARRLAAFESRDRQDFAKGGAKTKIIRHLAAFWNAGLQANVKLAQSFKQRPFQTIGKGLLYITTAKMLEQAVNWDDEDYWDRPQWERDLFFLIPIGKGDDGHTRFIRIPTPFEPGVIFGTLPGRVLQWARNNDPEAVKDFPRVMLQQGVPNPIPQTLQTVFSDFLSGPKGWDIYRGRTVVPESIANLPPEMQYTEQTSLTAKKLGKALGYSPMKLDHIIATSTGGVGQLLTHQVSDRVISAVTGEPITAKGKVPGGRFVTTPAAVSSQSIDEFYKTLEQLRTEVQRAKAGGKPELDVKKWAPIFERQADAISKLRTASRNTKDESERKRLAERQLEMARQLMNKYREAQK